MLAVLLLAPAASSVNAQAPPTAEPQRPVPADGGAALTELALEDLVNVKVYAASRFVQDVAQAPASVTSTAPVRSLRSSTSSPAAAAA